MIRVLIISDILLYLDGLAEIIGQHEDIEIAGTCEILDEALSVASKLSPNVVLLDMAMHNSITAIRAIKRLDPSIKIVALGVPEIDKEIIACAEAGISNYVTRQGSISELIRAVKDAMRGELRCSPKIAARLLQKVGAQAADRSLLEEPCRLTPREMEIAHLIDLGLSNKEIATKLFIEVSTVKNHVHNLLEKLNVRRRGEAAAKLRPLMIHFTARQAYLDRKI
jgi:DNA-binding NarL/FixJ family response regulator